MDVYQRRRLVALSAIAAIFIFIVLLIRSCGDDEEPVAPVTSGTSVPGAATALSQEDYVNQADSICQQTNVSLAEVDTSDPTEAAAEEAQLLGSQFDQLQSLSTPTDGADELNRFLSALQRQVAALDDRVLAAERGDDTQVVNLETTIAEAEDKTARAADRFGFEFCGDLEAVGETTSRGDGGDGGETEATTDDATTAPPVEPAPTTAVPTTPVPETGTDVGGVGTAPPADTGTDTGTDTGGTDPGSGGVSP
jgi:hypothetical protein